MNLGKLNEDNDIATTKISPSNEEPSVLSKTRGRRWCRNYLYKKKKRSIDYLTKLYVVSSQECCIQKTLIITWITWRNKMTKCAWKYTEESHPCSSTSVLSHLTIQITPNVTPNTPRCARGKNIFDMRYIFIPIHHGLHFTCAVIHMEEMKIEYYDSLCFENVTRHGCEHKIKMQKTTLQVLRDYLQK